MEEKVREEAKYVLDFNKTIREAANYFKVSKSAMHRDLSYKLKNIDYPMYLKIKKLFLEHNNIRHIKGGFATKKKYKG